MGCTIVRNVVVPGIGRFWRPETFEIFSRRDEPPALIFASRRSRRRRACFWFGVSSGLLGVWYWDSELSILMVARESVVILPE